MATRIGLENGTAAEIARQGRGSRALVAGNVTRLPVRARVHELGLVHSGALPPIVATHDYPFNLATGVLPQRWMATIPIDLNKGRSSRHLPDREGRRRIEPESSRTDSWRPAGCCCEPLSRSR